MKANSILAIGMLGAALSTPLFATQDAADQDTGPRTDTAMTETRNEEQAGSEDRQAADESVDQDASKATVEQRENLVEDAITALQETRKAIVALGDGNAPEALDLLAHATGKLELVLARNPNMILAPVDVQYQTYDLYATVKDVEAARKKAIRQLKDGRIQDARYLLDGLRSDLVVQTVNLPLGTYPDAIKAIVPLIDDGLWQEARQALQVALNSLVVTEVVYPLPILRAEHMLARAEELTENETRTIEENDQLERLLKGARKEIKLAEALGYGNEDDLAAFHEELDQIAEKTKAGGSGKGFFDRIKERVHSLMGSDGDA